MLSRHLKDELPLDGDTTTLRPFGKARQHQATYFVLPLSGIMIAAVTVVIRSFRAMFHAFPLL
jgi:hypothetical protein